MSAARPTVSVYACGEDKVVGTTALPAVLLAPIRTDVVQFVHTNMAKNARQAYGVSRRAGHRTTAESWGTGRAVARIPRASGGGTNRSGQGAYGNMCRGGRMFAPTKVFRRWHRCVNKNQRRYAVCAALAASAVPALVMARGHRIEEVAEVPLVVDDTIATYSKTADAIKFLNKVNAMKDVEKVNASRHIRPGKGKWRNRRYLSRKGPLVVFADKAGQRAFGNISGVDTANVNFLNLLQLAPGGHLGRFVIWTKGAFDMLDKIFGTSSAKSSIKSGYAPPPAMITNTDITRVINSQEVQKACRKKLRPTRWLKTSVNPLKNRTAMKKLSPMYTVQQHNKATMDKRRALQAKTVHKRRRAAVKARREAIKPNSRKGKKPAAKPAAKAAAPAAKPAAKAASPKKK